jgi:hypothetical protein
LITDTDSSGARTAANAFFVRNDLAPELPRLRADEAYRYMRDRERRTPEDVVARCQQRGLPLVDV